MDNIKEIVKDVIGKISQRNKQEIKLEEIWADVLEEKERKHTQIAGLKNHHLSVNVDSPAWLYQMNIRKGNILRQLQNKLPELKQVSFHVGKVNLKHAD